MPDARPLRADARRNRERIMAAAQTLFAQQGNEAQMEDIAALAGVGVGTLYRRFPTKQALLTAMVRDRFHRFVEVAIECERIADPLEALTALMRRQVEETVDDAGFQLAMMSLGKLEWEGIEQDQAVLVEVSAGIIDRAREAGVVRSDLRYADLPMLMCGITSTMYYQPGPGPDWRRHLELAVDAIRP